MVHMTSENELNQKHIAEGARGNGEQHLPFPPVDQDGQEDRDGFRDPVASRADLYIFQTIHDEHPEDRQRQGFPEILDESGRWFL